MVKRGLNNAIKLYRLIIGERLRPAPSASSGADLITSGKKNANGGKASKITNGYSNNNHNTLKRIASDVTEEEHALPRQRNSSEHATDISTSGCNQIIGIENANGGKSDEAAAEFAQNFM